MPSFALRTLKQRSTPGDVGRTSKSPSGTQVGGRVVESIHYHANACKAHATVVFVVVQNEGKADESHDRHADMELRDSPFLPPCWVWKCCSDLRRPLGVLGGTALAAVVQLTPINHSTPKQSLTFAVTGPLRMRCSVTSHHTFVTHLTFLGQSE